MRHSEDLPLLASRQNRILIVKCIRHHVVEAFVPTKIRLVWLLKRWKFACFYFSYCGGITTLSLVTRLTRRSATQNWYAFYIVFNLNRLRWTAYFSRDF